ncbi:MAG: hypothetical protein J0L99_16795, partial [Chitinophagales bacterium]|nr:hypothetical protein [Chitinophagales bacterium]
MKKFFKKFGLTLGGIKNGCTFAPALSERGIKKLLKFGVAGFESRFRLRLFGVLALKKNFKKILQRIWWCKKTARIFAAR